MNGQANATNNQPTDGQRGDNVENLEAFGLGQFVQRNECLALSTTKK
jgi:hypothetical protein